jgi:hypothetical protein
MPLNGTGARYITTDDMGDLLAVHTVARATGNYPANGEPIATFLTDTLMGDLVKQYLGVVPVNVDIGNSNLGHVWSFDPAQGTMGTLRLWETIGATPGELAPGAYGGNEATAVFPVTFFFPKFRTTSA